MSPEVAVCHWKFAEVVYRTVKRMLTGLVGLKKKYSCVYTVVVRYTCSIPISTKALTTMCNLKVPSCQIGSTGKWYHWIDLEKDINRYRFFDFLISLLNIWKDFKALSRFMQKIIQPPACSDYGLHRILSSYWVAYFYWMKKSAKVLLYFGLDFGMLKFFTHEPASKEQLMSLSHF